MKICARCAEENPDRARFCLACGSELPLEREERFRKVITLLFSDVVGSTTLGERLDPEALSNVMTHYYETMKPIVERHGGTVAKFIGDAIMAVFGVPILHEDDALRACRAAIEMQRRLAELNVELERRWGVTLATRTGLNTGEVSGVGVARAQNFVAGDAANTAARFQQHAQAGQILMGDSTYRLVRDGIRIERVEPLTMKGKADPVPAYLLLDVLPDAEALTRRHHAPLVGRGAELDVLERTFREVAAERSCAMVTILADAGAGKSRLVEEVARRLPEDAVVLRGRCLSYGEGITFWPLLDIVRELAGLEEDDAPDLALGKIARAAGQDDLDAARRVGSAVGLSPDQFPLHEIFWGVRRLLEDAAAERPLVVVFDDLHWAEPAFLDLVEHLVDSVSDTPLLLLCPARPELLEQRPDWRQRPNVRALVLKPLSDAEAELVIGNMLGDVEIAADARARIVGAAEGNPLFVEQMLSMMLDEGLLRRVDGRLEATAELSRVTVPPSIDALLRARVDGLPRDERGVVEPAAVVGLVFPRAAVEDLLPEEAAPGLEHRLATLAEKQLVRPETDGTADRDSYRFNHLLIRDAVYEGLLKEARASLHERVAEWAERVHPDGELEEILGYHLEQAHRYRSDLGPLDEHGRELGVRASERLAAAGRRALERGDM
ncbi:MAG: AAA family ATPase, partial [Actinomycetota bacterium]|nr:AAA family ATPase [Actinomycetota bacterium]